MQITPIIALYVRVEYNIECNNNSKKPKNTSLYTVTSYLFNNIWSLYRLITLIMQCIGGGKLQ